MKGYHVAVEVKNFDDALRLFAVVKDTVGYKEDVDRHLRRFPGDLCYSVINGFLDGWCYKKWFSYTEGLKVCTIEEFLNHYAKSVHKIHRRTRKIDF